MENPERRIRQVEPIVHLPQWYGDDEEEEHEEEKEEEDEDDDEDEEDEEWKVCGLERSRRLMKGERHGATSQAFGADRAVAA